MKLSEIDLAMSAILINPASSRATSELSSGLKDKPKKIKVKEKDVDKNKDKEIKTDSLVEESPGEVKNEEEAREERKATGRSVAIVIFLSLMCLALYHVIQRKTTILAGVS